MPHLMKSLAVLGFVVVVTGPLKGERRTTVPYSVETAHPGLRRLARSPTVGL